MMLSVSRTLRYRIMGRVGNNQLRRLGKGSAVAYFKVENRYFPGGTEEDHEDFQ